MYPAPLSGKTVNQYVNTSSFSISFWVNPRRTTSNGGSEYKAGTILHSSSSFAISIVSGSEKDDFGNPEKFRIMVQLSQSADTAPSTIDLSIANNTRSAPQNYIFLSPDNSLKLNNWHHVTFSWDKNINYGSGSMWIDCDERSVTKMNISTSSINISHTGSFIPLIVGNYYNGSNNSTIAPQMKKFFNAGASSLEGIQNEGISAGNINDPSTLNHKPNVDLHDIRIHNKYLTQDERKDVMKNGPKNLDNLIFYLPPFYTKESPYRRILRTPYFGKMTASVTTTAALKYGTAATKT